MAMTVAAGRAANPERLFYQAMVLAIIASILLGFAQSFFLRPLFPGKHAPGEVWFYVHGVLFTGWLALLFTQVTLIGTNRVALHQRLGVAGFVFIPLMLFMGLVGTLIAARRPGGFFDVPVPPLEFMVVPIYELLLFALFATLALVWRKTPQTHKRLMLLAAITLVEAGTARWPFEPYTTIPAVAFWTQAAFLIPLVGWDLYSRKSLHPATIWGSILLISEGPLRDMLSHTQAWMTFAKWSTGLLG